MALIIVIWAYLKSTVRTLKTRPRELFTLFFHYIRHNIAILSMAAFIALYAYISITGNLNIGLRHLFPIFPFIYILTTVAIFRFYKKVESPKNRFLINSAIILLPLILISETAAAYPSYMSYFNQIVGGPKNGYHYVTDSNADWGQDLKRLKTYLDSHPEINRINVNYFGGADVRYYLGGKYIDWWDSKRPIEPGWYAVSTNYLEGSIYDKTKKDNESYRWIQNMTPVYQAGTSILIYHIAPEDIGKIPALYL